MADAQAELRPRGEHDAGRAVTPAVSYCMFINFIYLLVPIPTPFQYLTVHAWTSSMTTPNKKNVVVDLQGLDAAACLLVLLSFLDCSKNKGG